MHPNVQYVSLNEAAMLEPSLGIGSTEIWYQKSHLFGHIHEQNIDPTDLTKTHVKLGVITSEDLDELYGALQGEHWSPHGEARTLIMSLGLGHTSMSMGDLIKIGNKVYLCDFIGWTAMLVVEKDPQK